MIIKANNKDITKWTGSITLDSSMDTLGDQLNFEVANESAKGYKGADVNVGDIITLESEKEVFRGIVVTKTRNEKSQTFSCFDYAFYLNKSKVLKQFNNVRADNAIKQLLAEFNVPVGDIATMAVMMDKIYFDKAVSEVIADILETVTKTTGIKYVKEMREGRFNIYQDTTLVVEYKVKLAENLGNVEINKVISSPTKTASIEEMRNSIKIYTGNDEKITTYTTVKNDNLIKKYGLLQETQSIEEANIAQAKNIAQNLLKELGKVIVTGSIQVPGSFDLRAGRILQLNEPVSNLVGRYKIISVSHSIGNIHTASLNLQEV